MIILESRKSYAAKSKQLSGCNTVYSAFVTQDLVYDNIEDKIGKEAVYLSE